MLWLKLKTGWLWHSQKGLQTTDPKPYPSRNVPGSPLLARGKRIQDAVVELEKKPGMSIFNYLYLLVSMDLPFESCRMVFQLWNQKQTNYAAGE